MAILKYLTEKINPVVEFGKAQAEPTAIAKFYYWVKAHKEELFLVFVIMSSLALGFGLGRLSRIVERKTPILITEENELSISQGKSVDKEETKNIFVASRNGKKYYFSWCEGVKRISDGNIISFSTREQAEAAGYEKATNCPGL